MSLEDEKRITEYHNKMVRDRYTIENLTTENARLREALKRIEKVAINSVEHEYESDLDYIADKVKEALTKTT